MYSVKQLIAKANERGVRLSRNQINYWKKLGLLPEPSSIKSRRGKPTYIYPEETLEIAIWLADWYSVVRNRDAAKIFLWLRGLDHVQVDPAGVIREARTAWHNQLKEKIPSIPPLEEIRPGSEIEQKLLDEIDESFARRGMPDFAALLPVMLGIFGLEVLKDLDDPYLNDGHTALNKLFREAERISGVDTSGITRYMEGAATRSAQDLGALGDILLRAEPEEADWRFIRKLWWALAVALDKYETQPDSFTDVPDETIRHLIESVRKLYSIRYDGAIGLLVLLMGMEQSIKQHDKETLAKLLKNF